MLLSAIAWMSSMLVGLEGEKDRSGALGRSLTNSSTVSVVVILRLLVTRASSWCGRVDNATERVAKPWPSLEMFPRSHLGR